MNIRNLECTFNEVCCPPSNMIEHEVIESTKSNQFISDHVNLASKCGERRSTIKLENRIASPEGEFSRFDRYSQFSQTLYRINLVCLYPPLLTI